MSGGRIAYQNNWVDVVTLREPEMQNLQPNDRFRFNGITNTNNKKGENKEVHITCKNVFHDLNNQQEVNPTSFDVGYQFK